MPIEDRARLRAWLVGAGRLAWCALGASAGLWLSLQAAGPPVSPFLLASLGGSCVFLFGLTRASAAQPRALFGGHLGGALIGIACFHAFGDAAWVYALSVVVTLLFMLLTGTVHPPAGANPLIVIHAHAGFAALWQPVGAAVAVLALVAAVWSRAGPRMARYPAKWLERSPPTLFWGGWD